MPSVTIYSLHHSEHSLSTDLHCRWQEQRAQNWCHSKKPQVEGNAWSERNINSDLFSKVAPATEYHLSQWRDRNVPLRYIKGAEWVERKEDQDLSPGYFALNNDSDLIPIEFDFDAIQWGMAQAAKEGGIYVNRPAPIELGLHIYNEEQVERSQWGPRDGCHSRRSSSPPISIWKWWRRHPRSRSLDPHYRKIWTRRTVPCSIGSTYPHLHWQTLYPHTWIITFVGCSNVTNCSNYH